MMCFVLQAHLINKEEKDKQYLTEVLGLHTIDAWIGNAVQALKHHVLPLNLLEVLRVLISLTSANKHTEMMPKYIWRGILLLDAQLHNPCKPYSYHLELGNISMHHDKSMQR